jgi:riboflavin biosynthesis pyrimidine reductase
VITSAEGSIAGCAARVEYLRSAPVDLGSALAALRREHAVRSILCEGGPSLNASLFAQGLVDELFLTTVPKLAGRSGALAIIGDAPLREPLDTQLAWLLECDGELFARYTVG